MVDPSWPCEESIQITDTVLSQNPEHVKAIILKAHLLGHQGDFEMARNILEQLLAKDASNVEA